MLPKVLVIMVLVIATTLGPGDTSIIDTDS